MRRTLTAASCALAGWAIHAAPALAQPGTLAPGAGALIIDQQRQDRQLPTAPPKAAPAPIPAPTADTGGQAAPATALRQVKLDGPTRLSGQIDQIAAPYVGKPLTTATVKAVADAVSAAYAKGGLALYTVAVPRQDLATGVLTLRVVEGYIDGVVINGPAPAAKNKLIKAYAAHLTRERPLTKVTLERYLSLIRDIPGLTVDVQLFNTTTPGAVRLALNLKQNRFKPAVNFNTRGTPRLGAAQFQLGMTANSLFRQGDQARISVGAPTDIDRFQFAGLSYVSPVGDSGLTVQGNFSYLRTRPKDPPIEGNAVSAGIQASYPLIRSYAENLYITGSLDGLDSDNAIYGLSITSDHTRAARASISYSKVTAKRTVSASVTGSQGVKILGARADTRLTDGDFSKLTAQVAFNQAIGETVALRLRGITQISNGRLPAAEQLPLGGDVFGRAFYNAAVVGDYGYGGSAELAWAQPKIWPKGLKGSELYSFIDGGKTWTRARLPFAAAQEYDLASAGAGFRLLVRNKLVLGLEGAKAIDTPYAGSSKPWRVVFSWRTVQ